MTGHRSWDDQVDFLVVGSGGGGMAAALTAARPRNRARLVSTRATRTAGPPASPGAASGSPTPRHCGSRATIDSRESIRRYLDVLTEGTVPADRLDAFVDQGPELWSCSSSRA